MSLHDIRVSQQPDIIAELTRRVTVLESQLEAIRSSLGSNRTPTYTSNVTTSTAPSRSLPGRDSVTRRQLNETDSEFSLTGTIGVAETSEVATPSPNYSKRPSGRFRFFPHISFM